MQCEVDRFTSCKVFTSWQFAAETHKTAEVDSYEKRVCCIRVWPTDINKALQGSLTLM